MKVSFAPKLAGINPYQEKLVSGLADLSVQLQGVESHRAYLPAAVDDWEPDILHLHWIHQYFDSPNPLRIISRFIKFFLGLVVLKLQKKTIIWTAHNLKSHDGKRPRLDAVATQWVIRLADGVIVHSAAAQQDILDTFRVNNPGKLFVIPHANYIGQYPNTITPANARAQLGIAPSEFVFLFFGLIRAYKGVPDILDAYRQLSGNVTLRLLIAGAAKDPALIEQIQHYAESNPTITLDVRFIPDEEVQVYMNASDVVLLPYRQFLTSGAVLLAMSFGRACIAPRQGCIPEVLDDGGAFLYDPAQPAGLLEAMQTAVEQRGRVAQMGEHNYTKAQQWSWEVVAQQTRDVYEKCMQWGEL